MTISMTDDEFEDFDLDDAEIMDDDWEDDFSDTEPMVEAPASSSGSPFFSRVIYPLVIILFIGGAGYFFYLKYWPELTKPRPNIVQTAEPAATVSEPSLAENTPAPDETPLPTFDVDDALPMPTPLDTTSSASAPSHDDNALTPLPDLNGIDFEPLPELDLSAAPAPVVDTAMPEPLVPAPQASDDGTLARIQNENSALSEKLALAQKELDEKNLMIAQLKSDLSAAQKAVKPSPTVQETKTMPSPPPPVKAPAVSTPKKVKSSLKPRPRTVRKPFKIQWVLRSAQPEKATVSRKNSNDLKTIQVGSSLSGVGRIQSISQVNGLWVVKGTNGQIKQ